MKYCFDKFAEIVYWVARHWCEFYLEEMKHSLYFKSDCFETWNYWQVGYKPYTDLDETAKMSFNSSAHCSVI